MSEQVGTNENDGERVWLRDTFQRGVPQLTLRAALVGMLLGVVMCLSNLYVFLKTGWSMGVTITAGILAFALFRAAQGIGVVRNPLGALENNALTTVSSGAGYMTGGGNMAAFGALLMITPMRPDTIPMVAWFAVIAALGVFVAIPIKRQLINREGLSFPTGTATAETLKTIHGDASGDGAVKARALGFAALFAGVLTWFRAAKATWMPFNLPGTIPLPLEIAGRKAAEWSLELKTEVVLVGAGALMSFRTAWSLLLGSLLTYGVLAPRMLADGVISDVGYKEIVRWSVWPGAALLVASGLTSFALDWRSVARTFAGTAKLAAATGLSPTVALADGLTRFVAWFRGWRAG